MKLIEINWGNIERHGLTVSFYSVDYIPHTRPVYMGILFLIVFVKYFVIRLLNIFTWMYHLLTDIRNDEFRKQTNL